jgi:lipopolysaccharide biosynthesis glycosyltransferase
MLRSVVAQRDGLEVEAHYLHGPSLGRRTITRLRRLLERDGASAHFHEIADARVAGLRAPAQFSHAVWYPTFLPELLPDADRVLVLDADTVAVDGLRPLWETDMADAPIGAVTNVLMPYHAEHMRQLGIAPLDYFNSGVILYDLALWRREGLTDDVHAFSKANKESLAWADQDALNLVLGHRRHPLHPRWNCMNAVLLFDFAADFLGAEAVREARERPGIRHFEGPSINKPWNFECRRPQAETYRRLRRGTPWRLYRPEGLTPAAVARRLRGAAPPSA